MDESLLSLQAAAALDRLADPVFRDQWSQLHALAPDATAYQGVGFVSSWYASYGAQWEPVLLLQQGDDGALLALWPLARRGSRWVVAGTHQAEYQGWLARPGVEAGFLRSALNWLRPQLGAEGLRIKYLVGAARRQAFLDVVGPLAQVRCHPRPLLRLDPEEIRSSLAKKGNKSRFNRLARLGELRFERLSSLEQVAPHLDRLIAFYDLRQGAVNSSTPFRDDERKRAFHCRLLTEATDQSVVSISSLGGEAIAGFWGLRSGLEVHLGMLIHSPTLAEHSPGKLHLMKLSEALLTEGVATIDLTPGGDAWKERFANAHDEVFELQLWPSAAAAARAACKESLIEGLKPLLSRVGVTPARARKMVAQVRKLTRPASWATKARQALGWLLGERREYRLYRVDRAQAATIVAAAERLAELRVNAPEQLLEFVPGEAWQTREGFWSQALSRLEAGHHAYTVSEGGRLLHAGWLGYGERESRVSEVGQILQLPEGSVSLYDFYTHPSARGRGLYRASLRAMLADAFSRPETRWAHVGVLADNRASRHVIESLGFQYLGSMHRMSRWGRAQCARDAALDPAPELAHA